MDALRPVYDYVTMLNMAATIDERAEQIAAVINGPDYKHAHWGILIADRDTGDTIYELNADKLFAKQVVCALIN